jgi:predicted nucleic acid-binding protein
MKDKSKNSLVVVDTSVFIEYLRGSSEDTLAILTLNNQVLLSPTVRLELYAGVRKKELTILQRLCNALLPIESFATPQECEKLLYRAKGSGLLGGIPDLLILADVVKYDASIFSYDEKMIRLAQKLRIKVFKA